MTRSHSAWGLACVLAAMLVVAGCARAPQAPASATPAVETANNFVTTRVDHGDKLAAGQAIAIENPYGDVRVRFGGFEHQVETHGVLQEPKGATHIELAPVATDDRYLIAPHLPKGATVREGQRIDLSVMVPEGHAVRVRTGQGLIEVRGVHGNVDVVSDEGNIALRGIEGTINAHTGGGGSIEASLDSAPRGSHQTLATLTGDIEVGLDDKLDAELDLATSALFATDYSLQVTRRPGEEPNKRAKALVGEKHAVVTIESRRGQIRLIRRIRFTPVGEAAGAEQEEQEDNDSD